MHSKHPCHSWAPGGSFHLDLGTSQALVDSVFVSHYAGYFFGASSSGFQRGE